jgi:PadR family transcriptional regulator, regulatory protein PadR
MAPSSPRTFRPHKELMTAWLLLLLRRGATYGYELRRELDVHRLDVDSAVLYRTLRKLEREGRVESRWMKSAAGPRRRFYRLTENGRRTLEEAVGSIVSTRDAHDAFLRSHRRMLADDGGPPHEAVQSADPDEPGEED